MLQLPESLHLFSLFGQCRPAQLNGHVCQALDFMHANNHAMVDRYKLLDASNRSFGSFGVVQTATVKRMQVCAPFVVCKPVNRLM